MRAAIIGGGVGGSAVALALSKVGHDATVHEAHPDLAADSGAFLTLATNGLLALAQMDAARPVQAVGFGLREITILDERGAEVATRPLGTPVDGAAPFRCLRWAELVAVLQQEVRRRGIPIRHGHRLTSLAETATGVRATFADGLTEDAEILIGADGLNSTVRPLIDPSAPLRRFAGQRVFYGYAPGIGAPAVPERITMIRGSGTAFGYAVSPAGEAYWFARVTDDELPTPSLSATPPAEWREWLVARLRADPTPAADIVAAADDRLRVTNAYDLPDVARWRTGRTMLIGDAAHAAAPATGQGASMALEDAVVLAKAVRDAGSLDAAFEWYERLRRPRVSANISASARMTAGQAPAGPAERGADLAHQLDWSSALTG